MISFTVGARRNEEVNAWDLHVEAWFEPAEEMTEDRRVLNALFAADRYEEEGALIGRLDALMVHVWPARTPEGLIDLLELNDGDGNTWDVSEGVRASAAALTRWAKAGGAERVFSDGDDAVETLIISAGLQADPFVDRGALLAMMVQHLAAFSPNRSLFAHEEPPELALPDDQRGRVRERARAFLSVGDRVGFRAQARVPKVVSSGRSGSLLECLEPLEANRLLLIGSLLPDGPDYPEWTVWDDLEIELIDVAEWMRARVGLDLIETPEQDGPLPAKGIANIDMIR
jgi:hypothetical protein